MILIKSFDSARKAENILSLALVYNELTCILEFQ